MLKILTREDLVATLVQLDGLLTQKTEVVLLGAGALLMLNIRQRATMDIDIANVKDAVHFLGAAKKLGVQVDIVTVPTTVDFNHCPTRPVFEGQYLRVFSVTEGDLIKLKLERYRKQDPEDIDEIIRKTGFTYGAYRQIVSEALQNFVGNRKVFILSALLAGENHYTSAQVEGLRKALFALNGKDMFEA